VDSENLLMNSTNNSNKRGPLVVPYSRALPYFYGILFKDMETLCYSEILRYVFPEEPLVSFRRDNNLQEILIHKNDNIKFYGKGNGSEP